MIKISPFGKLYGSKCYKQSFSTRRAAKNKMKRGNTGRKMKTAYQCNTCKQWHLSHLSHREYIAKVAGWKLIKFLQRDLSHG